MPRLAYTCVKWVIPISGESNTPSPTIPTPYQPTKSNVMSSGDRSGNRETLCCPPRAFKE